MDKVDSYSSLVNQGLVLPEQDFTLVTETIIQGANEAMEFLEVKDEAWPKIVIADTVTVLGYCVRDDNIGFSLRHLNHISQNSTPLMYKDQLVCFMPDTFYIIIKYLSWLKLFGRESTIHRYQKLGNPKLHTQFPDFFPPELSVKHLLLSNIEVEARTLNDLISKAHQENPLWEKVNEFFQEGFPQYYNKNIDELVKLPRPTLPISFEMESFGI